MSWNIRNNLRILTVVSFFGGITCIAQSPQYQRPAPPSKDSTIEIRARYLFTPDISFKGLGNVPFLENYISTPEGAGTTGTPSRATINFDDGIIAQDFISTDTQLEGQTGAIPSPNASATSNFSFVSEDQLSATRDYVLFHRYASTAPPDAEYEANVDGSMGWELAYTRKISSKFNLGLQFGFSFNGFDSGFQDEIEGLNLEVQEFKHSVVEGDQIEFEQDADGNSTGTYIGETIRDEDDSVALVSYDPESTSTSTEEGGATVNSSAQLRSSIYTFRAGPVYALELGKRFSFNLGAGVSAIYYSGEFTALEILSIPGTEEDGPTVSRGRTTTTDADWQVGPYIDASANFWLSSRVSVFSGLQYQGGSSYNQDNDEREVDVDFNSQVFVHAGFGIRF